MEEDEVELPTGKKIDYIRYGSSNDGVVIIAKNTDNEILFIKEYSYVPNRVLLQLPMGSIKDGESIENAANRELQEETDYKASQVKEVGSYYQNHRRSTNKGRVVYATDLLVSTLQADIEEEGIEIIWIPVGKISTHIENGEIIDTDTLSSLRVCGL